MQCLVWFRARSTLPAVRPDDVRSFEIPLPPLNEQRRIVAKIEALQVRSRKAREALEAIPPLLDQFRQSVLAAAFRGDLTAAWRRQHPDVEAASVLLERIRQKRRRKWEQDRLGKKYVAPAPVDETDLEELPNGWCWSAAEEIVEPGAEIVYGIVQPGPRIPNGIPYVRGNDIQDGKIIVDQLWKTSPEIAARYERAALRGGDVILGIIRATKVAVVPQELTGGNITQGTARFRPSSAITTEYLAGWLESPFAQSWLHDHYRGIDMPGLNLRDVRRLPVPLAPLAAQHLIKKTLAQTWTRFFRVSENVSQCQGEVKRLDESILTKAFSGELVPQDPDDEPATVLLERVRASSNGERHEGARGRNRRRKDA
jgi:type I restriction enzyme S subunit